MNFLPQNLPLTGIGSLPGVEIAAALDSVFALDIPYLPSLPSLGPEEGMMALGEGAAWRSFLQRVRETTPAWVKLQGVGPVTLRRHGGLSPAAFSERMKKSMDWAGERIRLLRGLGCEVLFFLDEPSLFLGKGMPDLAESAAELRSQGSMVGLHCCGPVDFTPLWDLDFQLLSFDVSLSLDAFLAGGRALRDWLERGGRPALGVVPTALSDAWNCRREVQGCRSRFAAALGEEMGRRVLRESLLTPACGLGLRGESEARAVFSELAQFKKLLSEEISA